MPLSISSSNERVPHCQYKKLWILSGCLCLIFSLIVESTYRIKGYLPNVDDNITLWSYWRNQVYPSKGRKKMVIIGASRARIDLVPKILEMEFPKYEVIQLAIAGKYCYAALEDLANDVNFDGIIICSFTPDLLEPSKLDDQKEYIEYYKHNRMSLNETVNLLLSGKIQENLCIMSSYNTPKFIAQDVIVRHNYYISYVKFQFNRSHPAFFSTKLNAQQLEKVRLFVQTENQRIRKAHDAMQMDEYINAVDKTISPLSDKYGCEKWRCPFCSSAGNR